MPVSFRRRARGRSGAAQLERVPVVEQAVRRSRGKSISESACRLAAVSTGKAGRLACRRACPLGFLGSRLAAYALMGRLACVPSRGRALRADEGGLPNWEASAEKGGGWCSLVLGERKGGAVLQAVWWWWQRAVGRIPCWKCSLDPRALQELQEPQGGVNVPGREGFLQGPNGGWRAAAHGGRPWRAPGAFHAGGS